MSFANTKLHAIVPASGGATRMRGLPKFLLPCDQEYTTLLERHVEHLLEFCSVIWIPTRPDLVQMLESLNFPPGRVVIVALKTKSMAETIRQVVEISSSEKFLMVMPDTYFLGAQPYEYLSSASHSMNLALWEIRDEQRGKLGQVEVDQMSNLATAAEDKNLLCPYKYAWGAMSFNREVISRSLDSMSSIGDVIPKLIEDGIEIHTAVFQGKYFDCGTPKEYVSLLSTI